MLRVARATGEARMASHASADAARIERSSVAKLPGHLGTLWSPRCALASIQRYSCDMGRALRERRLGSRMRHDRWSYAELFSVTLLLIWWSAMFRVLWVLFMLVQPGDLGLSWLDAPAGGPSLLTALAIVEIGLLAMTAACFVEARNRTRLGVAIGAFNLSFVLALSGATFLQGSFARQLSAHRTSGVPSEWNLARGLAGEWQVVGRLEPDGAPRFPAHALTFGVIPRAETREMPGGGDCFWSADVSDANTDRLELRLTSVDLVKDPPDARVWLGRVRRHEAGWDLAQELSGS
jgi:hypothetical protein